MKTWGRMSAQFFLKNLRNFFFFFWLQNRKNRHFFTILAQFEIFSGFATFYGILSPFLCAKFSVRKFGSAKELTFRRSALGSPPPTSSPAVFFVLFCLNMLIYIFFLTSKKKYIYHLYSRHWLPHTGETDSLDVCG